MGKIVKDTIVGTIDCVDKIYKKYENITQLPVVSAYWDDKTGTFILITSQEVKSYLTESKDSLYMKNCLILNGKSIELSAEQVKEIEKAIGKKSDTKLKDIPVGEVFKIADYEFIVLEHSRDTTAVILKGLLHDRLQFGSNNNFNDSNVDVKCTEFGSEIAKIVGKRNLIEHTVDLTSDDGLKDYCKVKRYVSLLTTDRYRRYVEILDKYKIEKWWWLATPYSTPTHGNSSWIKCVSPSCDFCSHDYFYYNGVRPFCILNSNIFVS